MIVYLPPKLPSNKFKYSQENCKIVNIKTKNGNVGELSTAEIISELSNKLSTVVSSIESTKQELMCII